MEVIKFVKNQYADKESAQKSIDDILALKNTSGYIGAVSTNVWNFLNEMHAVNKYFNKSDDYCLVHAVIETSLADYPRDFNNYIDEEEAAWDFAFFIMTSCICKGHQAVYGVHLGKSSQTQIHMLINSTSFIDGADHSCDLEKKCKNFWPNYYNSQLQL